MSIEQMEHQDANNHRNLGRELGIFMFSADVGSGLPLWLPRGAVLRDTLERFLRQAQFERGYLPVVTPHIGKLGLYKTSGHWYKYRDSIYPPMLEEDGEAGKRDAWMQQTHDGCGAPGAVLQLADDDVSDDAYILKPMNCPHHIQIFKHEMRSYRDLPLRLAEFGTVYRFEQSGELNGLLRTRDFTVDDSHIFVTPERVEDEFMQVIDLALSVFQALKLKDFAVRVGVRDPASSKYIGSEEAWEKAQAVIMNVVRKLDLPHTLEVGEAGFYGPKLDFLLRDTLGRQWQLGTAQVDYNLPERFDLGFIGEDGQRHRPVMIHRANFGSIERVVAILLEHFGGALPAWLAPVQVALIPIADKHIAYAQKVSRRLQAAGLRSEVDSRSERMNAKIRAAQMQKIPYMLVVGDKEEAEQEVSVRLRTNENLGNVTTDLFIKRVLDVVETKSEGL
jgi:threonyl-tRNA synthetase